MNIKNPIINIFINLLLWMIAYIFNNLWVINFVSIIGSILILYWFWNYCIGISFEMIRLMRVGAMFLVMVLNLSWLVTFLLHMKENRDLGNSIYYLMDWGMTIEYIVLSIIYVIFFCFIMCILGSNDFIKHYEVKIFKKIHNVYKIENNIKLFRILLTLFSIINLFLIFSGIISFRSINIDGLKEGELPFWYSLYFITIPGQMCLEALLLIHKKSKVDYFIFFYSFMSCILLSFVESRRSILFCIISIFYWYFFFKGIKPKRYTIIIILITLPIFYQVSNFFNYIRGENSIISWKDGNAIEILYVALGNYTSSKTLIEEEAKRTEEGNSVRSLVVAPLAYSIKYENSNKECALGENLVNSLIWTIPNIGLINKFKYPVQEDLLYKYFPIGSKDTSDSIYLGAYLDFFWLGIIIYPCIIFLIWLLVLFLSSKVNYLFLLFILSLWFKIFTIDIGEASMLNWFVALRGAIFLACISYLFTLLNKKNENIVYRI